LCILYGTRNIKDHEKFLLRLGPPPKKTGEKGVPIEGGSNAAGGAFYANVGAVSLSIDIFSRSSVCMVGISANKWIEVVPLLVGKGEGGLKPAHKMGQVFAPLKIFQS